jgi:hypothetical protein
MVIRKQSVFATAKKEIYRQKACVSKEWREVLLSVVSGLVDEVGVPGGADLPAVLAGVAGVRVHVLCLHVVLHPLPRVASNVHVPAMFNFVS